MTLKIAVYDKVNKNRLLGHLKADRRIQGYVFKAPLLDTTASVMEAYRDPASVLATSTGVREITFNVEARQTHERKQIDWATSEVYTVERKVLETNAPLEDLMKLDNFSLPGESSAAIYGRRRFAHL